MLRLMPRRPGIGFAAADLLLLAGLTTFLFAVFDTRLLSEDTVPSGGDMAAWYAQARHLSEVLLPAGRLTGWDMGHFGGAPSFQFYFLPPFLLSVIPSKLFGIPLSITLKWAMTAGIFLFPAATWLGLRMMRYAFPIPVSGAAMALVFVLNEAYNMFGGNALSTLAGEFCYMTAFALLPIFVGCCCRCAWEGRGVLLAGAVLGVIGLSHPFVFIPALALPAAAYFQGARLIPLLRMAGTAFGLMAFWLLPLIAFKGALSTPIDMVWQPFDAPGAVFIGMAAFFLVFFPPLSLGKRLTGRLPTSKYFRRVGLGCAAVTAGVGGFAATGAIAGYVFGSSVRDSASLFWIAVAGGLGAAMLGVSVLSAKGENSIGASPRRLFLWMALAFGSAVAYFAAYFLRVPDIRFLPPLVFALLMIVTAETFGGVAVAGDPPARLMWAVTAGFLAVAVSGAGIQHAESWFRQNFKGYQGTAGFQEFAAVNRYLNLAGTAPDGNPLNAPRVGYEKCDLYAAYGGDRAFETIPLFSGRQTLEGIHYAAASGARSVAFLQSEFSKEEKTPEPLILSRIDPEAAADHCRLYNVSHLVVATDTAKRALSRSSRFVEESRFGPLSVYRLADGATGYVTVPEARPVLYTGREWRRAFYRWFKDARLPEVHLVPDASVADQEDRRAFAGFAGDPGSLDRFKGNRLPGEAPRIDSSIEHHRITFRTSRVGAPHLVKVSYSPQWKVDGASGVYPASPHFMMVIPRQPTVTLRYGRSPWEIAGLWITGVFGGCILFSVCGIRRVRRFPLIGKILPVFRRAEDRIEAAAVKARTPLCIVAVALCLVLSISGALLRNRPVRAYTAGERLYRMGLADKAGGRLEAADDAFLSAVAAMGGLLAERSRYDHRDVINCILKTAACFEQLGDPHSARKWYRVLVDEYPFSRGAPAAHEGLKRLSRQSGRREIEGATS